MTILGRAPSFQPAIQALKPPLSRAGSILWRIALFLTLWGILLAPAVIPKAWIHELGRRSPVQLRLYFDLIGLLASLAAGWVMMCRVDRRNFSALGFSRENFGVDWLRGLAGGTLWLALSLGLVALVGAARFAPGGGCPGPALALAAAGLLLNAAVQEIIARSYIFQLVWRRAGPGWAVLVSSVLFTAMHAAAFQGAMLPMVNVFAASVLFGLVLLRTGSLWAVIALHFAWNFLVGPVLGLVVSGHDLTGGWRVFTLQGPAWLTGGAFGLEGSAIVTLVTIAGGCAVAGAQRGAASRSHHV